MIHFFLWLFLFLFSASEMESSYCHFKLQCNTISFSCFIIPVSQSHHKQLYIVWPVSLYLRVSLKNVAVFHVYHFRICFICKIYKATEMLKDE